MAFVIQNIKHPWIFLSELHPPHKHLEISDGGSGKIKRFKTHAKAEEARRSFGFYGAKPEWWRVAKENKGG